MYSVHPKDKASVATVGDCKFPGIGEVDERMTESSNKSIDERLRSGEEVLSKHLLPIPMIALNLLIKKEKIHISDSITVLS